MFFPYVSCIFRWFSHFFGGNPASHSYWKWHIEIVDLPIDSMVIFHSFLYVLPEGILFQSIFYKLKNEMAAFLARHELQGARSVLCFMIENPWLAKGNYLCRNLVGGDWNMFYDFPFSWECHHPIWRTHIFRGVGIPTTNQKLFMNFLYLFYLCWAGVWRLTILKERMPWREGCASLVFWVSG